MTELTIGKSQFTTWQIHPNVRWFTDAVQKPAVLQQAWVCIENGNVEWRDVELVVQSEYREDK